MYATVGEIDLKDEFALLPHNSVLSDVSKALTPVKNSAALIRAPKGKGIAGIIKAQVLLSALTQGEDPLTFKASEIMSTNLLRLKSETPIKIAIEKITELRPDAVLVIDSDGVFAGYLSAEDFREMKSRFLISDDVAKNLPKTIEEAVKLRDEFRLVPANSTLDKVSLLLRRPSVQFVLAQDKKKGVVGIISVQQILSIFSKKTNPEKERIKAHMKSNLLRLRIDTPIVTAVEAIKEREPEGVLVLDREGKFHGFLSPDDFRKLTTYIVPEIQHDGTFDSLMPFYIERVSQGNGLPIVLTHTGSSIAIHDARANLEAQTHALILNLDVSTLETGKTSLQFKFDLGLASSMSPSAKALRDVEAPPILQHTWGDLLINLSWLVISQWMDAGRNDSSSLLLYGMDENGKLIFEELKRDSGDDF